MSQQAFGFRAGFPTGSSFPVIFLSLSNADITINCGDFKKTLTAVDWIEVGADHPVLPRLGYVASTIVTGRDSFKRHLYSVSQNGVMYSGSAMTAPIGRGKDFSLFFNTCDNNTFGTVENAGAYKYMKEFIEAENDVLGLIHVDDHYGYTDSALLSDAAQGVHESTGWPNDQARATGLEYDYAMGYFAAFGLFVNEIGSTSVQAVWGQDITRIWAMRNINVWPQWGDHDAGENEMGWDILPGSDARFVTAKNLWDLIMGPLQPPNISNRATANHWAGTVGALTVVAPDGISLGSGDATANYTVAGYGPASVYTNNQIDDCLDALNNASPFKIAGLQYGLKYLDAGSKFLSGAQNPLKNGRPLEYERMYTRADPANGDPLSVMASPNTNGMFGTFITMHGDYHANKVQFNQAPSFVGNHAENFYSFSAGTLNGSINFGSNPAFVGGYNFDGTVIEVYESASKGLNSNGGFDWWNIRIDIKDSIYPPEMIITDTDKNKNILWSKKFVQGRGGNFAFDIDDDLTSKVVALSGEEDL